MPGIPGDGVPQSECAAVCVAGEPSTAGVSAGVIAGSCAGTLALGGAFALLLRRWQQQRRRQQQQDPWQAGGGKAPLLTGFLDAGGKQKMLVDHVEDLERVIGGNDGVALESI